jgi:CheY-like chemotaxis protein
MMRCLIVDDDEFSRSVIEDLVKEIDTLELIKSCSDAVEAFKIIKEEHIDLVFLDIEMPKMDGLEMMRSLSPLPQVILVTAHEKYAVESYEYDVTEADSIESLPEDLVDFAGLDSAHKEWIESELYEQWGDAERTDWYDAKVNPTRVGYYEITTAGWDYPQFCEWNGDRWIAYNEVVKWRGLAEEPNEAEVD